MDGADKQTVANLTVDELAECPSRQLARMILEMVYRYPEAADCLPQVYERFRPRDDAPGGGDEPDWEFVGRSSAIKTVFQQIRNYASSDAPVLITGESGTGKELAARAVHERSGYRHGPFVAINCGGLPSNLAGSELFGHEKGAFTGAETRRLGAVEQADGGTLFLDEIGELPLDVQPTLLRFLQSWTFSRVGDNQRRRADVRIVAATNCDLEAAVKAGRFRSDLFYRLDVLRLHLPPLRERGDDVVEIARYLIDQFADPGADPVPALDESAVNAIRGYAWPGNVRELMTRIRRALTQADDRIGAAHLGLHAHEGPADGDGAPLDLKASRARAEYEALRTALTRHGGDAARAARELGCARSTVFRLAARHGISTNDT